VAIKNREHVLKNPKKNKSPWGKSWDQYPKDYSCRINDPKYPTAWVCDFVLELGLHLGVIDLISYYYPNYIMINSILKKY